MNVSTKWEERTLDDIGETLIGLTYSPTQVGLSGDLVLRSSNIQNGALDLKDVVRVKADIPDKIRVRQSDILICVRNGSRSLIGKSLFLDRRVEGETFGAFMAVFRSPLNEYLRFFFQSDEFKRQVDEHLGATINQITNRSLRSFRVLIPPASSRVQVVNALADVSALILSTESLIAKKQAIAQGMTQQLLTGKTRLPGFTSGWDYVSLGSLGRTFGGLTGKGGGDFGGGTGRFVTFMDVMSNMRIDGTRLAAVSVTAGERQNVLQSGDILLNGSSETPDELAMASVVVDVPAGTMLNSFCFGFRLAGMSQVDPTYIAYYLRGQPGRRLLSGFAQGSIRYNLSKRQFLSLGWEMPNLAEQRAIADVLADADAELQSLRGRLQQIRLVKQGMMQELLTGRTRLFPEEVTV